MEIKKVSSNSISKDAIVTEKNMKLECNGDECYLVPLNESNDEEAAFVLETAEIKSGSTEEETSAKEPEKNSSSDENKAETTKTASGTKTKKKSKELITLTKKNIKKEVRNQKGTTFVIVTGPGCGRCNTFEPIAEKVNAKLGDKANFTSLTLSSSEAYNIFNQLKNEAGCKKDHLGYPIIIKCVDGKAEELYDYSDISSKYYKEKKMISWFEKKIEGTKTEETKTEEKKLDEPTEQDDNSQKSETSNDCSDGSCTETGNSAKTSKNKYIQSLTDLSEEKIAEAKNSLSIQIQAAQSIGELKNILLDISKTLIDINTQLAIMDAINEIKYSDDLSSAKANVLKKLS